MTIQSKPPATRPDLLPRRTHADSFLRVSHADRDAVVTELQQAYGEGRLDEAELDSRLHLAMTAKTGADLAPLLADLPGHQPEPVPVCVPEPEPDGTDRVLAGLGHTLGALTLFVGPLVMYVVAGRRSPYLRRHLAAALNFQLTLLIVTIVTFGIGGILYSVAWLLCGIAALLALLGVRRSYPFQFNLFR